MYRQIEGYAYEILDVTSSGITQKGTRKTQTVYSDNAANNQTTQYSIKKTGYDKNGNILWEECSSNKPGEAEKYNRTEYEYNNKNLLAKVITTDNSAPVNYTQYYYDEEGRKIRQYTGLSSPLVNGSQLQKQTWDGDQIILETDSANVVKSKYIRGINLLYSVNGTQKCYGFNGHGDTVQLTDSSGNVVKSYDYDAFGVEKKPDTTDTNVFRYCGEYFDKETGTIYLRARYYDPATSRMLTEDSYLGDIRDPLSLNLYTYCNNAQCYVFCEVQLKHCKQEQIGIERPHSKLLECDLLRLLIVFLRWTALRCKKLVLEKRA